MLFGSIYRTCASSNKNSMLTDKKAIKELQAILKKDYGKDVSSEDAADLGHRLLRLTRVGLNAQLRLQQQNEKGKK